MKEQSSMPITTRQTRLPLLAKLSLSDLETILTGITIPKLSYLKQPETGAIMLRGKTGAVGAAFNLGETTVTQCIIRLETEEVGYSYILGSNKKQAHDCAVIDALMEKNISILAERLNIAINSYQQQRKQLHKEVADTKVNFFTMVRGED